MNSVTEEASSTVAIRGDAQVAAQGDQCALERGYLVDDSGFKNLSCLKPSRSDRVRAGFRGLTPLVGADEIGSLWDSSGEVGRVEVALEPLPVINRNTHPWLKNAILMSSSTSSGGIGS